MTSNRNAPLSAKDAYYDTRGVAIWFAKVAAWRKMAGDHDSVWLDMKARLDGVCSFLKSLDVMGEIDDLDEDDDLED